MHDIPGIHVATGRFQHSTTLHAPTEIQGRHASDTRLNNWLSAAIDSRYAPSHSRANHQASVTVLFEGYLADVAKRTSVDAAPATAVLGRYMETGLDCLTEFRGSYTALVLDGRTNEAHLFNDRRASRPLFYRESADHALLIGPEVFRLASVEPALREIDPVAVCEFLIFASGYESRTLFHDIKKMPPGSVMTIRPDSFVLRRYWEIQINVDKPPLHEDAFVEEALSLFDQSMRRLPTNSLRPFLFLSGGIDSRVILGGMRNAGLSLPTVTYGTEEGDDVPIARQLAAHCGLPITVYPISTRDPHLHFADAATRSDCRAETIDTPTHGPLLDRLASSFDLFVQGDKSFFGKEASTPAQALVSAGIFSLTDAVRLCDVLDPSILRVAQSEIEQTLRNMAAPGSAMDPQDLKDKIYYEQRIVNRQNAFTAANLRQFEQARPWLDEDLVDFLFALPGNLRRDKRICAKMLELGHADLATIPFASRDSIPQAQTYRKDIPANPGLAAYIRSQFGEGLDSRLAALFRPDRLASLINCLLAGKSLPIVGEQWWSELPGMWRFNVNRYRADLVQPISIMLRLMQLNLYLHALDNRTSRSTAIL